MMRNHTMESQGRDAYERKWHIFFIVAMLANFCVLGVNAFFTDDTLVVLHSTSFSWFSQIFILVWGAAFYLAYLSFRKASDPPWIVLVFFVEKIIYGIDWLRWLLFVPSTLTWEENPLIWFVLHTYGAGDFAFGFAFLYYFLYRYRLWATQKNDVHVVGQISQAT